MKTYDIKYNCLWTWLAFNNLGILLFLDSQAGYHTSRLKKNSGSIITVTQSIEKDCILSKQHKVKF